MEKDWNFFFITLPTIVFTCSTTLWFTLCNKIIRNTYIFISKNCRKKISITEALKISCESGTSASNFDELFM